MLCRRNGAEAAPGVSQSFHKALKEPSLAWVATQSGFHQTREG